MKRELQGTATIFLAAAVLFGTLLPELWRLGLAASGVTIVAAIAGPNALLQVLLLTAGLSLAPITENQRALLPELGGFNLDGLRLLAAMGGFAWIVTRVRGIGSPRRLIVPYLALLGVGAISLIWAPDRVNGARLLLKQSYPLIGFFLAAYAQRVGADGDVRSRLAVGALLAAGINLLVSLFTASADLTGSDSRYTAGLGHNLVGHFSAITALACYAWWTLRKGRLYGICAVVLTAQLLATGSRTAFVSLGVGVLVLEIARRRWSSVVVGAAVAVCTWAVIPTLGPRTESLDASSSMVAAGPMLDQVNLSGRLLIWNDVLTGMVAKASPLGMGIGAASPYLASRYDTIRLVHNEFLRVLAEIGPAGLLLFLAAYLLPMTWAVRLALRSPRTLATPYALAAGGIAMFLLASFAENTFEYYATYSLFPWIYLGLASRTDA